MQSKFMKLSIGNESIINNRIVLNKLASIYETICYYLNKPFDYNEFYTEITIFNNCIRLGCDLPSSFSKSILAKSITYYYNNYQLVFEPSGNKVVTYLIDKSLIN